MPLVRKSQGRQKVEMRKMEKKSSRQVTFSKRRVGLFKKASELCTLCGAKVAVIVFSPGKKVFSFGHPSVEFVVDRYLGRIDSGPPPDSSGMVRILESHRDTSIQDLNDKITQDLNDKITQASSKIEMVKKRGQELERLRKENQAACWWETPVEDLREPQLDELTAALLDLRDRLRLKIAVASKREADKAKNKPNNNPVTTGNNNNNNNSNNNINNLGLFARPNNNVSAPSVNFGAFGPYGGGGIFVPIGGGTYSHAQPQAADHHYRVMPIPMLMPIVNNNGFNGHHHDGFMMVPPAGVNNDQVFDFDSGHVVGGFQNLLFGNDSAPEFMELGGGHNTAGPEFGYPNQYGYGFF